MDNPRSEKRKKIRILSTDVLISASLIPVGTDVEIFGFVVDTSAQGFQISIPKEIAPQTTVKLTITRLSEDAPWESEDFIAKIRWCRQDEFLTSFNVGVEIMNLALVK